MTQFGPRIEPITSPTPGGCATIYATDAGLLLICWKWYIGFKFNKHWFPEKYLFQMSNMHNKDKWTSNLLSKWVSLWEKMINFDKSLRNKFNTFLFYVPVIDLSTLYHRFKIKIQRIKKKNIHCFNFISLRIIFCRFQILRLKRIPILSTS